MLYAIMTQRWISGLFESEQTAQQYLQEISTAERDRHSLVALEGLQYPVYLIEDAQGFRFMGAEGALEAIQEQQPVDDEDDCCATLYRFKGDFRPNVAGADEMGKINHQHIDNDTLKRVHRDGVAGLWLMLS